MLPWVTGTLVASDMQGNSPGHWGRRYDALADFPSLWQFCPSRDHAWKWHSCLDYGIGLESQVHRGTSCHSHRRYGAIRGFFLASALLSEDHACSWHCYLTHRHPGGIKCEGMLVASDTRKLALLESCTGGFYQLNYRGI